jgi:Uma2 family endonuclease
MPGEDRMRSTAPTADTRLTYDDLVLFPADGRRHEIIDGVHYVTPSPRLRHQDLVGRLHLEIALYLRLHPEAGRVFLSPLDVVLSYYDVVEPDLLLIAGDQAGIMTEKNIQGAPALVVEVLWTKPLRGRR